MIDETIIKELQNFVCKKQWKYCRNFDSIKKDIYGLQLMDSIDYVIDIGSCLGEVAYVANKIHQPIKTVAIEASPITFNCLKTNIGHISNIVLYNRAIYHTSNILLDVYINNDNIGENKIGQTDSTNLKVNSLSLEDLFVKENINLEKNIFIKIDCEGSEKFILNSPILKQCNQISIEIHERDKEVKNICDLWYPEILQTHKIVRGQRSIGKNYEIILQHISN